MAGNPTNTSSNMTPPEEADHGGWIDLSMIESMLTKPLNFICALDGSAPSMAGLNYVTQSIMQKNRETFCEVVHAFDPSKNYLPAAWKPDALKSVAESTLTGAASQKRWKTYWVRKDGIAAVEHIAERASDPKKQADFVVMGYCGRKGKANRAQFGSNCSEAIKSAPCAVIVMKDDEADALPIKRAAKFVVSVSLNKASTKAFIDALRLSRPGDEIHVVYVKGFMESTDSDYTQELREKYSSLFAALKDGEDHPCSKFCDRKTEFAMIKKQRRESTAQAVVRYGDEIEADFMVVGSNALRRIERGKSAVGSVSLDICMEWDRNFIVSHWIELNPRLYEEYGGLRKSYKP